MKTNRTVSKGRLREGRSHTIGATHTIGANRKYESVMRHIRSIKESSQWNRETNPYARAAFDAVFNLIDSSYIDLDQAEDDMMEEEYRAENNEMFQQVLQGIYHALEQFIPQVDEIFGPDGLNIIFGDELYDLSI